MTLAIMQPYFLPYIGYWQLMNLADAFIVYDNIEYTKKGWINRNRYLFEGQDKLFTLPLVKDSDYLDVCNRRISPDFDKKKLMNQIQAAYVKAPFFNDAFELFNSIIAYDNDNLFEYIFHSIHVVANVLGIKTKFIVSSSLDIDHSLRGKDKVLALCKSVGATQYVNPIGGIALYNKEEFAKVGIKLSFLQARNIPYPQFGKSFVPFLSILDVLMFCGVGGTSDMLNEYDIR